MYPTFSMPPQSFGSSYGALLPVIPGDYLHNSHMQPPSLPLHPYSGYAHLQPWQASSWSPGGGPPSCPHQSCNCHLSLGIQQDPPPYSCQSDPYYHRPSSDNASSSLGLTSPQYYQHPTETCAQIGSGTHQGPSGTIQSSFQSIVPTCNRSSPTSVSQSNLQDAGQPVTSIQPPIYLPNALTTNASAKEPLEAVLHTGPISVQSHIQHPLVAPSRSADTAGQAEETPQKSAPMTAFPALAMQTSTPTVPDTAPECQPNNPGVAYIPTSTPHHLEPSLISNPKTDPSASVTEGPAAPVIDTQALYAMWQNLNAVNNDTGPSISQATVPSTLGTQSPPLHQYRGAFQPAYTRTSDGIRAVTVAANDPQPYDFDYDGNEEYDSDELEGYAEDASETGSRLKEYSRGELRSKSPSRKGIKSRGGPAHRNSDFTVSSLLAQSASLTGRMLGGLWNGVAAVGGYLYDTATSESRREPQVANTIDTMTELEQHPLSSQVRRTARPGSIYTQEGPDEELDNNTKLRPLRDQTRRKNRGRGRRTRRANSVGGKSSRKPKGKSRTRIRRLLSGHGR